MKLRLASRRAGFTLIEILVVIGVIGILVSLLAVAVTGVRLRAFEEKTLAMMRKLETGCQNYVTKYNAVPPLTGILGGPPADPGGKYVMGAGAAYTNSHALHYWLASSLWVTSGFRGAGAPSISRQDAPLLEFAKGEISTWDAIAPAAFGGMKFTPLGGPLGGIVSANGGAPQAGFVLDSWYHAVAYIPCTATTGDMAPAVGAQAIFGDTNGDGVPESRSGSSRGKVGRNLTGFCQMWSRGANGTSGAPGPGPGLGGGAALRTVPTATPDDDDICNWFLPYY